MRLAVALVATALIAGEAAGRGCDATAAAPTTAAAMATARSAPSPCSDPCVAAARGEARECASSASGAFADTIDGCLQRDHECVDACREQRRACRDATDLAASVAACRVARDVEIDLCSRRHPLGDRRVACVMRARAEESRCRRAARRAHRREVVACAVAFDGCADACAPGAPPDGVTACRDAARSSTRGLLTACKRTLQASMTGCLDKELQCGLDCVDARDGCLAPTQAALATALAACTATQEVALQQCASDGGPEQASCITAARADAYACGDAALQASIPGVEGCVPPYVQCVKRCPPAGAR